ncbi:MAG: phosphatase PAP2 family protein [Bacteroidales bacterium]|nr:phosphatase PAP2 family protein [Bacteroidales bacterium]
MLWGFSQSWSWAIVLILAFCFTTLRREPRNWWLVLLGIVLCFLLSDRISVLCFKDVFCRLRPCHALEHVRMFNTSCGGQYGFVSSHAANAFSLALFLSLRNRKALRKSRFTFQGSSSQNQKTIFPLLIFLWALIVGYSRPYLGKHYPGDVICGALLGVIIGLFVFYFTKLVENVRNNRNHKKIFSKR